MRSAELAKADYEERQALEMLLGATWIPGTSYYMGYFHKKVGTTTLFFNRKGEQINNPWDGTFVGETS